MTVKKCSSYVAIVEAAGWQVLTSKSLFGDTIWLIVHAATGRISYLNTNVRGGIEESVRSFISDVDGDQS